MTNSRMHSADVEIASAGAGASAGAARQRAGALMTAPSTREITIAAALVKCATGVDAAAPEHWAFTLSNGTDLAASARVDDGWLLLDAPLDLALAPAAPASSIWQLLRANATLGGGARFALDSHRPALRVRAELPLEEEVDLHRRILESCAGFKSANGRANVLGYATAPSRMASDPDAAAESPDASAAGGLEDVGPAAHQAMLERCRQTGWSVSEREPGRLAVDLDVPGAFQQAIVETRSDLSVAVSVPALDPAQVGAEPAADVCRQALGLLLLRVCGTVRMARAAAEAREGATHAWFEVVFGAEPCGAELGHAFAALSVACRVAAQEVGVLWADEAVAKLYVEQWQRASESQGQDRRDRVSRSGGRVDRSGSAGLAGSAGSSIGSGRIGIGRSGS